MTLAWRWKYRLVNTPGEIAAALPVGLANRRWWRLHRRRQGMPDVNGNASACDERSALIQTGDGMGIYDDRRSLKLPKMLGSPTFGTITFKL